MDFTITLREPLRLKLNSFGSNRTAKMVQAPSYQAEIGSIFVTIERREKQTLRGVLEAVWRTSVRFVDMYKVSPEIFESLIYR